MINEGMPSHVIVVSARPYYPTPATEPGSQVSP
jgi:hypothetical protein